MVEKAGGVSPLHRASARPGIRCINNGGLVVPKLAETSSQGRPKAKGKARAGATPKAVTLRTLVPPSGFPARPPPGLVSANQAEAVTQAVMGQVQAMFERFTESF